MIDSIGPGAVLPVVAAIEGAPPKGRVVIVQWDSMEKFQAWQNDPEAQNLRKNVGDKYATFRSFTVEGLSN
jgi:heme-degrading monooxygenase HmoA